MKRLLRPGCTLIGERLVGMLDPEEVEGVLDRADATTAMSLEPRSDWPEHLPSLNSVSATYQFVDEESHEPVEPRVAVVRQSHGFVTRELDGAKLQWMVLRQRWVGT